MPIVHLYCCMDRLSRTGWKVAQRNVVPIALPFYHPLPDSMAGCCLSWSVKPAGFVAWSWRALCDAWQQRVFDSGVRAMLPCVTSQEVVWEKKGHCPFSSIRDFLPCCGSCVDNTAMHCLELAALSCMERFNTLQPGVLQFCNREWPKVFSFILVCCNGGVSHIGCYIDMHILLARKKMGLCSGVFCFI